MKPSTALPRTTNILDLNDDCLREFFAVLDLSGICVVADVCARFRYIARDQFPRSFPGNLELHRVHQAGDSPDQNLHRVAALFRNFSDFITSLDAKNFPQKREHGIRTLELIARYCSRSLRELSLNLQGDENPDGSEDQYYDESYRRNMIHSLSQLKRLKIVRFDRCPIYWTPAMLEICRNFEDLTELYYNKDAAYLDAAGLVNLIRHLPRLRLFHYDQRRRYLDMIVITADIYKDLLEIVRRRRNKVHLTIYLKHVKLRMSELDKYAELARQNEHLLTLVQLPRGERVRNLQNFDGYHL